MDKLSAVIITYNEERNIGKCLDSVKNIADEIVVVDSYSSDKTEEICKSYGVRFFQRVWDNYSAQKNYANSLASFDYVLSIDADEVLSEELEKSIVYQKQVGFEGYYTVNRVNNYLGKKIYHCGWYPDKKIRIWSRVDGFWTGVIHEKIEFKIRVKACQLNGDLIHNSYTGIENHLQITNKYTTLIAQEYFKKDKKSSSFKLVFSPIFGFFRDYIFKQGFRDGWRGVIICMIAAYSTFLKYAKLKELYAMCPTVSLIITTYNSVDKLEMVLLSVLKQKRQPDEIIIADDGSTEETKRLIEKYTEYFSIPVYHCWQEDNGFQASKIRNKGIAKSSSEYIIIIDGDIVLNKNFIEDHILKASKNYFIQGSRVLVSQKETLKRIKFLNIKFSPFSFGIKNRINTFHWAFLSRFVSKNYGRKDFNGVRSCNMSFWKEDLLRINGFDENFVGWGREDNELVVRLLNNGIKRKNIKFGAVAYHLWHEENKKSDEQLNKNQKSLEDAISAKKITCSLGVNQYL